MVTSFYGMVRFFGVAVGPPVFGLLMVRPGLDVRRRGRTVIFHRRHGGGFRQTQPEYDSQPDRTGGRGPDHVAPTGQKTQTISCYSTNLPCSGPASSSKWRKYHYHRTTRQWKKCCVGRINVEYRHRGSFCRKTIQPLSNICSYSGYRSGVNQNWRPTRSDCR